MRTRVSIALAAVISLAACGGAETPSRQAASPATAEIAGEVNQPPSVDWVEIEPSQPLPGRRIRALAQASDPEGDRVTLAYDWRIDGEALAQHGDSITLVGATKGQTIEVMVTASDREFEGETRTATAYVGNTPPVMRGVKIEASSEIRVGTEAVATPDAEDPDGDELEYEYHWYLNGEDQEEEGPTFSTENLHRGDQIYVVAVALDGDDPSGEASSDPIEIQNSPPQIVSQPTWTRSGDSFSYTVEAEDLDGDRSFRFRLKEGPDGMTIDPVLGEIQWQPQPSQAGEHTVEVEVDDGNGGTAGQRFSVSMSNEEKKPAADATAPAAGDFD